MPTDRRALGDAGERLAERHLTAQGWRILERNWRGSGGEIDLIGMDGEVLVFVEVKTRRGALWGTAEEAVSPAKAARLLSLGAEYVGTHPEHDNRVWRVDLVAITLDAWGRIDRISHIANACEER